jgi:AraC family transcriptional regulator
VAQSLAFEAAAGRYGDGLTLEALLAELEGGLSSPEPAVPERRWLSPILDILDGEPDRPWTLVQLAAIAERHPVYLARAFRAATGLSVGGYRRTRRLIRACIELRTGRVPLSALAADQGYADQAHMTRELRRFLGTTPRAFRRGQRPG